MVCLVPLVKILFKPHKLGLLPCTSGKSTFPPYPSRPVNASRRNFDFFTPHRMKETGISVTSFSGDRTYDWWRVQISHTGSTHMTNANLFDTIRLSWKSNRRRSTGPTRGLEVLINAMYHACMLYFNLTSPCQFPISNAPDSTCGEGNFSHSPSLVYSFLTK